MTTREAKDIIENPQPEIAAEQESIINDILTAILVTYANAGWSRKVIPVLIYNIAKAIWPHILRWIKLLRNRI